MLLIEMYFDVCKYFLKTYKRMIERDGINIFMVHDFTSCFCYIL